MSDAKLQLITGDEITDLEQITEGLYKLIDQEEAVNPIRTRPLRNQAPTLLERISHPTYSSGRWAFALHLILDTGAFAQDVDSSAKAAAWIVRAFDAGKLSAFYQRELALRYLSDYDHLFHMFHWRCLNGYVRFKSATAHPIRSRIERVGRETEENSEYLGSPPDSAKIVSLVLQRHYLRYAKIRPEEATTQSHIAKAIVEACNLGLLYQSIQEETPLLSEVHALYAT